MNWNTQYRGWLSNKFDKYVFGGDVCVGAIPKRILNESFPKFSELLLDNVAALLPEQVKRTVKSTWTWTNTTRLNSDWTVKWKNKGTFPIDHETISQSQIASSLFLLELSLFLLCFQIRPLPVSRTLHIVQSKMVEIYQKPCTLSRQI